MSGLGRGRGLISDTDSGAPGARRRLSLAVPSSPEGTGWAARDTEDAIASRGCRQSLASSPEDPMGRSSPPGPPGCIFPHCGPKQTRLPHYLRHAKYKRSRRLQSSSLRSTVGSGTNSSGQAASVHKIASPLPEGEETSAPAHLPRGSLGNVNMPCPKQPPGSSAASCVPTSRPAMNAALRPFPPPRFLSAQVRRLRPLRLFFTRERAAACEVLQPGARGTIVVWISS